MAHLAKNSFAFSLGLCSVSECLEQSLTYLYFNSMIVAAARCGFLPFADIRRDTGNYFGFWRQSSSNRLVIDISITGIIRLMSMLCPRKEEDEEEANKIVIASEKLFSCRKSVLFPLFVGCHWLSFKLCSAPHETSSCLIVSPA